MAFPHPTPNVPGRWPHLHSEVEHCFSRDGISELLLSNLAPPDPDDRRDLGSTVASGHVCATTWVFDPSGRYALLVRHRLFDWSSPGGHIDPRETSREGGLRELEEETGLTRFDVTSILDVPALIHVTDLSGDRPHRHWNIAWLYTAEMDSPLSPVEGARWWSVDSLPSGPPDLASTTSRLLAILDRNRTG
jgi:8-oxo-dGTP pyrophosphatase MutT (NUDIX family)